MLFDALTKVERTTQKRFSINNAAAREAYKQFEINSIGLIRGDDNPADSLTKVGGKKAPHRILNVKDEREVVE